jgi:hypothetical protein
MMQQQQQQQQMQQQGDGGGKNPLKLRLDLNLEVEIELKAHIHGDLTLALLYVDFLFRLFPPTYPFTPLQSPCLLVQATGIQHSLRCLVSCKQDV